MIRIYQCENCKAEYEVDGKYDNLLCGNDDCPDWYLQERTNQKESEG